jgi:hypothetical protein
VSLRAIQSAWDTLRKLVFLIFLAGLLSSREHFRGLLRGTEIWDLFRMLQVGGPPVSHVYASAAYARRSPLHRLTMSHISVSKTTRRKALIACLSFLVIPTCVLAQQIATEERRDNATSEYDFTDAPWAGPSVLPQPDRLIAIGDLHGDLGATKKVLRLVGVLHEKTDEWIGGKTVVVQIGDQLDRGDDEIDILALLYKLRRQAEAAGGGFHVLLGNHETMTASDQMVYGSRGEGHAQISNLFFFGVHTFNNACVQRRASTASTPAHTRRITC